MQTPRMAYAHTGSGNDWHFSLAPLFLWAVSLNGTARIGAASSPLELEFNDDLAEGAEAVLTWHFEARKNKLGLIVEMQNVDLAPATTLSSGEQVIVGFKNIMLELGASYSVFRSTRTDWQRLGGARLNKQNLTVNAIPSPPYPLTSFNTDDRWVDVFIGARVFAGFAKNWDFIARADIAGGQSDSVWNLVAMLDYRFTSWGSFFFGYRLMDYDYDNNETGNTAYAFNATQQGPLAGLNIYW